ncbi:MAG: energy transducer TonB [Pseudomonadota bacterium]
MGVAALQTLSDRGYGRRLLTVALAGVLGAGCLTWFMSSLILSGDQALDESGRAQLIDFVRLQREEASERKDRRPERPEMDEQPPAPATPQTDSSAADNLLNVSDLALPDGMGEGIGIGGLGFDSADGDYLPIVKIAPIYPQRALLREIVGICAVAYTVTTTGATRDVRVIESMCPNPIFYNSSIEAAKKFKYRPRIIDGEAVEVHGVINRFIYELPGKSPE